MPNFETDRMVMKRINNRLKELTAEKECEIQRDIYRQAIIDFLINKDEKVLINALGKKRMKRHQ